MDYNISDLPMDEFVYLYVQLKIVVKGLMRSRDGQTKCHLDEIIEHELSSDN